MTDRIPDDGTITPEDRQWAEERVARLESMCRALDEDLESPASPPGEWAAFWDSMRHLYTRAAFHLATGVRTGDVRTFNVGRALWNEVRDGLDRAERRLGLSPGKSS